MTHLSNFLSPRIFYFSKLSQNKLAQLIGQSKFKQAKYVLSLVLGDDDKLNDRRLKALLTLASHYKEEFAYVVVKKNSLESIFPHLNIDLGRFSLFSIAEFTQNLERIAPSDRKRSLEQFKIAYSKTFLSDPLNYYESADAVKMMIDKTLADNIARPDSARTAQGHKVITIDHLVEEINGEELDRKIMGPEKSRASLLLVHMQPGASPGQRQIARHIIHTVCKNMFLAQQSKSSGEASVEFRCYEMN